MSPGLPTTRGHLASPLCLQTWSTPAGSATTNLEPTTVRASCQCSLRLWPWPYTLPRSRLHPDCRIPSYKHYGPSSHSERTEASPGLPAEAGADATATTPANTAVNHDVLPTPAEDGATAPGVRVAEESGVSESGLPFLLFCQEYAPEVVFWTGHLPASIPELFATIAQLRAADSHRRSPRLVPVYPQPQDSPPSVLALPHWPFDGVAVLIDNRIGTRRIFVTVLPGFLSREDVAFVAGVDADSQYEVYTRDVPWPVPREGRIYLTEGDRLLVCDPRHDPGRPVHLRHLLQGEAIVSSTLPFPDHPSDIIWVLSDGPFTAVPIRGDRFASDSALVAEALALPAGQFSLVPSRPDISTHARRGTSSQGVFIACQIEDFPPDGHGEKIPFILDLRPILLCLSWSYAPSGNIDVAALCSRLAVRCPAGYHVRLFGGQFQADQGNHFRQVETGEVITAEFQPNYVHDVVSQFFPSSFTLGGGTGDPPRPTGHGGHSVTASPSSRQADAGTGSTQQGHPGQQGGRHYPPGHHTDRARHHQGHERRGSPPPPPQLTILPRTLLLLSTMLISTRGMQLPAGESIAQPTLRQEFDTWPASTAASKAGHTFAAACFGRPIPTPCRSLRTREPDQSVKTPLQGRPSTTDTPSPSDILQTLLEESVADASCPAFWLAATLLDTLVEHFGDGSSPCGSFETTTTTVVSLVQSLPPAPVIDLSAVSLPLYQDIEQVVRWTTRGGWDPYHPPTKTALCPCPHWRATFA